MAREQRDGSGGSELGRFLRARRTRVTPGEVGLTVGPGLRRTPGLRREELATLAGVSVDHYVRLERGRETRPSPAVVDALARALLLDEIEHEHLRSLAARAALTLAEAATRVADNPDGVPDAVWQEAAAHYDEEALAALVMAISAINAWNRINITLRNAPAQHLAIEQTLGRVRTCCSMTRSRSSPGRAPGWGGPWRAC
ncbi:helix-turn-helix domain-containing protein [Nonomuraea sp. NPDC004186]